VAIKPDGLGADPSAYFRGGH